MNSLNLAPFSHPGARAWTGQEPIASARAFHHTLDGYRMSPLTELPTIAAELDVGRVYLKDESERLGLPAFKVLGASWAVARSIAAYCGIGPENLSVDVLRRALDGRPLTLVTATDGNHGRAISHMARLLGIEARVFTPAGVSATALEGIRLEGAELIELNLMYDDVVRAAAASTVGKSTELLIQDTSWPGYETVPRWIVEGYTTLFSEIDEQLAKADTIPDVLVIPTGVGSLLQAAIEYYRGVSRYRPAIVSVEPTAAACVLVSLNAGEIRSVDTSAGTIMTGLCTGSTSKIAWPSIRDGLNAAVAIDDATARIAVGDLAKLGLDVGPCGAATLAGLRTVYANEELRAELDILGDAVIVLLSTEGLAANPLPKAVSAEHHTR